MKVAWKYLTNGMTQKFVSTCVLSVSAESAVEKVSSRKESTI